MPDLPPGVSTADREAMKGYSLEMKAQKTGKKGITLTKSL